MTSNKLIIMIYDEGIRPDVMAVLERLGVPHFTRWVDAEGAGRTGPRQGNPIWPGLNDVLLVVVAEAQVEPLVQALHELRDSYPITPGMRFIITEAQFI